VGDIHRDIEEIRPYHIEVLVTGMVLSGISKNITVEFRFWINRFIDKDRISSHLLSRINEAFVELDNFSSRLFSFPAQLSHSSQIRPWFSWSHLIQTGIRISGRSLH